jgi:hypothetical protein
MIHIAFSPVPTSAGHAVVEPGKVGLHFKVAKSSVATPA